MDNIKIAYIGGGSRAWAWTLMMDLAQQQDLSGEIRLYDIDLQAAKDNEQIGNALFQRPEVKSQWHFKAVNTLKESLIEADFVIISILPGTFKEMHSDVHEPESYGIYQPVGDSVGPGGLMRALRTLPIFMEFAEAIKAFAKDAWVINYTNPMALCTRILYETFPGIKAFGCCHEIFHTQDLLVDMLREQADYKGPRMSLDEIKINVLGINHFTWINRASYKNIDLLPLYDDFVNKHYENGFVEQEDLVDGRGPWQDSVFSCGQRVKFDLYRRYGAIAAAGDRHLAEFTSEKYLKNPETVKSWQFHLTPVAWRVEDQKAKMKKAKDLLSDITKLELKPSKEKGVDMMKALLGQGDLVTNVNLPNQGQINDIPLNSVVETNALFRRDSVAPVISGALPEKLNSLINLHVTTHEMIIKAVVNKDLDMAFRAFMNDPMITLEESKARELFDKMIANTRPYLNHYF